MNSAPRGTGRGTPRAARTRLRRRFAHADPFAASLSQHLRAAARPALDRRRDLAERQHRDRPRRVRIACCGMPKITAVSSDSAITRPPQALDRRHALPSVVAHAGEHDRRADRRRSASPPTRTAGRPRARTCRSAPARRRRASRRAARDRLELEVAPARRHQDRARRRLVVALRLARARTRVSRSSRSAKPRVKPSGMCCATRNAQRRRLGNAPKICISAAGPPVDEPITTTRGAARRPRARADDASGSAARAAPAPCRCAARGSRAPCGAAPARSTTSFGVGARRRLRDEVDGAELERLEHVVLAVPAADHDHGRRALGSSPGAGT